MRVSGEDGKLTARAVAGSEVVLLAMNLPRDETKDLLGFALGKAQRGESDVEWLPNFLRFEAHADDPGRTETDRDPVQAFVWGDYEVDPGSELTYRVETRYGDLDDPEARHRIDLEVDVEDSDDGGHGIYFNRGVAGSQAYAHKFHNVSPLKDEDAARWLSRGLEEALLAFIEGASGEDVALRGAFYEFHHDSVLSALARAHSDRDVDVRFVVARPKPNDDGEQAYPGDANVQPVEDAGLTDIVTWRTLCSGQPHNKFLVRLEDGKPVAVWTGSTNITPGAFYGQSNVGHLVHDPDIAKEFLAYWKDLDEDPETDRLRDLLTDENPLPDPGPPDVPRSVLFSPHHGERELRWFADLIASPENHSVFVTAPFGISATFEKVLLADHSFPVYALLDKGDDNMKLLRAGSGNLLTAGAFLGDEGWRQFLEEKVTGLNPNVKFIHNKYLLINPLGSDPLVITGSANFSGGSVSTNDENMLVIRGDTRVADVYLSEFMRLFTHLYFRAKVTEDPKAHTARTPTPESRGDTEDLFLKPDDSWVADWFGGDDAKTRERELFASG
jgi:hypothetical protein